jgi:hypothetical protein
MTIPNNPACPFGCTRDATNLGTLIRRCTFLRPRHWFSLDNKLNPQVVMDMRTTTGSGLLHANYRRPEASPPYNVSLLLFFFAFLWKDYTLSNFFSLPIRP